MDMKLYLVRHGETLGNRGGIIQGQIPGKLSEDGIIQVNRIAKRLQHEKFDCIYSSDLARAADTARGIHRYHLHTPLVFVKELRERNFGPYEGKVSKEVGLDWENLPPEVESTEAMEKRMKSHLDKAYATYPDGSILFVSHGGALNALFHAITNRAPDETSFLSFRNTSITILEITEDKDHTVHLLNCVKHLE